MKLKDVRITVINQIYVIVGALLLAFAITSILKPSGLMSGGLTGAAIILEKVLKIDYTMVYYLLSILILISTWILLGRREATKIIIFSLAFPMVLILFDNLNIRLIEKDLILASAYFGIIGGAGIGLILKSGYSQGGTDTIAKIFHNKLFPFISISQLLLFIDLVIIISSIFVYDRTIALYAILTQFILIKTVDIVVFGFGSKKVKIEIISTEHNDIASYILNDVRRGITSYSIEGGYTNEKKTKLVTVCSPRESMLIKEHISKVDSDAFVDVLPIISVWGKGSGFDSLVNEI